MNDFWNHLNAQNDSHWEDGITSSNSTVAVGTSAMKLFQSIKEFHRKLGLDPPQPGENSSINSKNLLVLLSIALGAILTAAFCVFEAETVLDYGKSYFASGTEFFNVGCFVSNIWKWQNTWKTIEKLETFIQKSRSKAVYLSSILKYLSFTKMWN